MRFLIVTPCLNRLEELKRCIASVRDQIGDEALKRPDGLVESVEAAQSASSNDLNGSNGFNDREAICVHHHIQDANSSDGTIEFLKEYAGKLEAGNLKLETGSTGERRTSNDASNNQYPITNNYRLSWSSAPDGGMYDAINKAWESGLGPPVKSKSLMVNRGGSTNNRSRITDNNHDAIVSWLNSDEQYLPGTLSAVAEYFSRHPDADVLFGDALVIRPDGSLLCARRAGLPDRRHMLTSYLTVFSAAMFLRADAVKNHALYPDPQWKVLGDVDLVDRMISAGVRFGLMHRYLAAFTDSGENISLTSDRVRTEQQALAARLSPPERALKPLWVGRHRLRKLLAGEYRAVPVNYAVYTDPLLQRTSFSAARAPAVWKGRL